MYKARIVTNSNKSIGFGPEYGSVFDISPLSGSDVKINTSQGFQQIGVTVESQSVEGISRTIKGTFIGSDYSVEKSMLDVLPVFTQGRLYFNEDYYTDIVIKKAPTIIRRGRKVTFTMMVFCRDPFWYSVDGAKYDIGVYTPVFRFPTSFDSHIFAVRNPSSFVDCYNSGSVRVPYTLSLTCDSTIENPGIINANTLEYMKLNFTMTAGDRISVYRDNGRLKVVLNRQGEDSDIFYSLDEESNMFWINPGENVVRLTADTGLSNLYGGISFNPAYMGVIDES